MVDLVRLFDGRWGRLWNRLSRLNAASDRALLPPLRRQLALAPGVRVLDLGAGSGLWSRRLAGWCEGLELVALDPSAAMMAAAQRELAGVPGKRLLAGDAARLPLADGAFDRILAANVFGLLPDLASALSECTRVLTPNGRLVVLDFLDETPRQRFSSWLLKSGFRLLVPSSRPAVRRHRPHLGKELRAHLGDAGLEVVAGAYGFFATGLLVATRPRPPG